MIPDANLFHFGILQSSVHMIFVKNYCGRLKSDFRYSATIIYNNFVWCESSAENVEKISKTAEKILRVRKKFSDADIISVLMILYKNLTEKL